VASPRAIATERGISQQGKRGEARFGSVRVGDSASTPIDRASPVGRQAARGRGLRSRAWVTLLLQRAAWGRAGGRDDARQGALPSVAWPSSTLTAGTTVLRRCGRAIPGPCSDGDDAADAGGPGSCPRCGEMSRPTQQYAGAAQDLPSVLRSQGSTSRNGRAGPKNSKACARPSGCAGSRPGVVCGKRCCWHGRAARCARPKRRARSQLCRAQQHVSQPPGARPQRTAPEGNTAGMGPVNPSGS
jgi:hypothetical protein